MRADRLIALLLFLQRRGRVTAAEVAAELEVSVRTARRDLEALAMSGVPIYSTHGRGGGWELIGGASTDLTGLSAEEARALFLAAGPSVSGTPELKSALRKLTSALPTPFQAEAEAATSAFTVDTVGWGQSDRPGQPRFLDELTAAVVRERQIDLDYQSSRSSRRVRRVHPLGLVTKRNVWYLVGRIDETAEPAEPGEAGEDIRTYRVSRILNIDVLDLPVARPPGFDLDRVWANIVTKVEQQRSTVTIRLQTDPTMLVPLRWIFGAQLTSVEENKEPGPRQGWLTATVHSKSERSFAGQIAGFGNRVTILEAPDEVYRQLGRLAVELNQLYGPDTTGPKTPISGTGDPNP